MPRIEHFYKFENNNNNKLIQLTANYIYFITNGKCRMKTEQCKLQVP